MKSIKFAALLFMIWGSSVYIKFGPIRETFQEETLFALAIAVAGMIVYRIMMED